MKVLLSVPVYPSEDPDRVMEAVMRIFPDAVLERNDRGIDGTAGTLQHFGEQIRRQKILDTARSTMLKGQRENSTVFRLNKQVALVGKISFTEERTVLGSIKVIVEDDDILQLIERTAPNTIDGEEVR